MHTTHLIKRTLKHLLNGRVVAQASRRLRLTNRRDATQRNADIIRDPLDKHRAILPLKLVHRELQNRSFHLTRVDVDGNDDDVLQPEDRLVSDGWYRDRVRRTQTSLDDTLPRKMVAAVR